MKIKNDIENDSKEIYKEEKNSLSTKQTVIYFLIYITLMIFVSVVLNLNWIFALFLSLTSIYFVPKLIIISHEKKYQLERYYEARQYMEELLYSFKNNSKIVTALSDIKDGFTADTKIHACIENAINFILTTVDPDKDISKEGLEIIESDYDCRRMHTIHKFILNVESIGGSFATSADILLSDLMTWIETVDNEIDERNKKRKEINVSIILAIALSAVMTRIMPSEIGMNTNLIVRIGATLLVFFNIFIFKAAYKKTAADWLALEKEEDSTLALSRYDYVINYNPVQEQRKSLKYLIFSGILIILSVVFSKIPLLIAGIISIPFFLSQHKISYNLKVKALKKDITLKFPLWLMNILLLLQTDNAQVAIQKSIKDAPDILKPELIMLVNKTNADPTSIQPYLDFMSAFNLSEIQSAMKKLFAISNGTSGNIQKQITDIISRNNTMLHKAEKQAAKDRMASMTAMFLAPQGIACFKLLVDMTISLLLYLSKMTSF